MTAVGVQGPLPWAAISERCRTDRTPHESIYDWCWVCGAPLGPDKMHVLIENGRVLRHTYCCRKHRYVAVRVPGTQAVEVQTRSDLEIESLSWAFKDGELKEAWE